MSLKKNILSFLIISFTFFVLTIFHELIFPPQLFFIFKPIVLLTNNLAAYFMDKYNYAGESAEIMSIFFFLPLFISFAIGFLIQVLMNGSLIVKRKLKQE